MNYKILPAISLLLLTACHYNNESAVLNSSNLQVPAIMNYTVTHIYPHDSTAFTEGLEWSDHQLYESTGEYGASQLKKVNLKTGTSLQKTELSMQYFGEGITILNGKIYQLTYKEGKCFVYDLNTFNKLKEFNYEGQGWGMTNDGKFLIMDDSTENLIYRDPETFKIIKKIKVTDNNGPLAEINELEYAGNYIYANVWKKDIIVKINPLTGVIVAKADLAEIWNTAGLELNDHADVLNGIAYDSIQNRFFITGKNWSKLFEVKFN
jgi:glutamine cyclotransferase